MHADYANFILEPGIPRWLILPTSYVAKDFIRI
jgi:hypothetical protein